MIVSLIRLVAKCIAQATHMWKIDALLPRSHTMDAYALPIQRSRPAFRD